MSATQETYRSSKQTVFRSLDFYALAATCPDPWSVYLDRVPHTVLLFVVHALQVLDAPGANSSSGSKSGSIAGSLLGSSGAAGAVAAANFGPMAQSFVGTPNYLAPEQLGCGPYNQKADIWACGCVLYEMAALRPAFKVCGQLGCMRGATA